MDIGRLDCRITISARTVLEDDLGGETETWAPLASVWANYRPGSGTERRAAAQDHAIEVASFIVRWAPPIAQVGPLTHRVEFNGNWDIESAVQFERRRWLSIVATRAA